jgi:hypothetical protein
VCKATVLQPRPSVVSFFVFLSSSWHGCVSCVFHVVVVVVVTVVVVFPVVSFFLSLLFFSLLYLLFLYYCWLWLLVCRPVVIQPRLSVVSLLLLLLAFFLRWICLFVIFVALVAGFIVVSGVQARNDTTEAFGCIVVVFV